MLSKMSVLQFILYIKSKGGDMGDYRRSSGGGLGRQEKAKWVNLRLDER